MSAKSIIQLEPERPILSAVLLSAATPGVSAVGRCCQMVLRFARVQRIDRQPMRLRRADQKHGRTSSRRIGKWQRVSHSKRRETSGLGFSRTPSLKRPLWALTFAKLLLLCKTAVEDEPGERLALCSNSCLAHSSLLMLKALLKRTLYASEALQTRPRPECAARPPETCPAAQFCDKAMGCHALPCKRSP